MQSADRLREAEGVLGVVDTDDGAGAVEPARRLHFDSNRSAPRSALPRLDLECMRCGYGIVSATPPLNCPMCHTIAAWTAPDRTRHIAPREHAFG